MQSNGEQEQHSPGNLCKWTRLQCSVEKMLYKYLLASYILQTPLKLSSPITVLENVREEKGVVFYGRVTSMPQL